MKKRGIFLTGLLLILIFSSFQHITAQEALIEEKQTEEEILKAIDEQKKAMAMQKKAQEDALVIIRKNKWTDADEKFKDILHVIGAWQTFSARVFSLSNIGARHDTDSLSCRQLH